MKTVVGGGSSGNFDGAEEQRTIRHGGCSLFMMSLRPAVATRDSKWASQVFNRYLARRASRSQARVLISMMASSK